MEKVVNTKCPVCEFPLEITVSSEKLTRYENALKFYADEKNWRDSGTSQLAQTPLAWDDGAKARAALSDNQTGGLK